MNKLVTHPTRTLGAMFLVWPLLAAAAPAATTCLIVPSLEVNVGTPVDGVLGQVLADRGDVVRAGQLLAKLQSGVEEAAVEYQAAKAQFGARKTQRNQELQKKQLISSQELDEMATEYKLSELELKERREQLRLRSLFSPINGVVVDRYRQRGDLVKQERIYRIAQLDPLFVETVVPAALFGKVRSGQSYDVTPQLSSSPLKARVANVDKVIDAGSGSFRVRLVLPNPKYALPSGQRCKITFPE
ncbi:MAG: efflux RND transporter periplasmic adaptor subunit [Vogesella sp.]|uniref:efflux RND transporter periplasmic adaptor subunit n=1 Tax=Vogesella sp. TaxID=1904252 RepID=UPI003F4176B1